MKHPTDEEIETERTNSKYDHLNWYDWPQAVSFDCGWTRGFEIGAKWVRDQQKWISIDERRPDNNTWVLAWFPNTERNPQVAVQHYSIASPVGYSHWMPLPEGPSNSPKPTTNEG